MAEISIKFGYLTSEEIQVVLNRKLLNPYSIIYNKTNHCQYLIKEDYTLFEIKSKMPIFVSKEEANRVINEDESTYSGEIVSVLVGDEFVAHIVQGNPGAYFVKPVSAEKDFSYNDLRDIPIKNVGTIPTQRVDILALEDGYYKVNYFISPGKSEVNSIVGNLFFIETVGAIKYIKRITQNNIFDYTVVNGVVSSNKYATEEYVKKQGYMTSEDVDIKLAALDLVTRKDLENYVKTTCEALCKHLINEELQNRACTEEDIKRIFN